MKKRQNTFWALFFFAFFLLNTLALYSAGRKQSLDVVVVIPDIALIRVQTSDIISIQANKPMIAGETPTAPLDIGQTKIFFATNSPNVECKLTLDPALPRSVYLEPDGSFRLVSTQDQADRIPLGVVCEDSNGHTEEVFEDTILIQPGNDSLPNVQYVSLKFILPIEGIEKANTKVLYNVILYLEAKSTN